MRGVTKVALPFVGVEVKIIAAACRQVIHKGARFTCRPCLGSTHGLRRKFSRLVFSLPACFSDKEPLDDPSKFLHFSA